MLVITLLQIVEYLVGVIQLIVFVMFVMSLLISFNVVNMHNDFVAALWRAVNAILDPLLNPIRRIMPNTGAIDFSPMVLLIVLYILGNIIIPNIIMANA